VRYVTHRAVIQFWFYIHRMWNGQLMMVTIAVLLLSLTAVTEGRDYSDLQGPYCASRGSRCCPDRRDDCSVPILGTRCYCDDFCNRTYNEDCCPDYWKVCLGMDFTPEPLGRMYFSRAVDLLIVVAVGSINLIVRHANVGNMHIALFLCLFGCLYAFCCVVQ
jgi:heme A synthase